MKINIAGDFVIENDFNLTVKKNVVDAFASADFNILNIEAPITSEIRSSIKTGPSLKNHSEQVFRFLNLLNVENVTLANNHICDYGFNGLKDTIAVLNKFGIKHTGAYVEKNRIFEPMFFRDQDVSVCVINIAENEWSNDLERNFGANPVDFIDNFNIIKRYRDEYDHLIMIYHGGHEFYSYPSPRMKKLFRHYIECGVDVVICHHSHCISGYENYNGKHIYYGLGNFLFDRDVVNFDKWFYGMFLELNISKNNIDISRHFVSYDRKNKTFGMKENATYFENETTSINSVIEDDALLLARFNQLVSKKGLLYENYLDRSTKIVAVMKKLKLKKYQPNNYRTLYNLVRCESHQDLLMHKLYKDILK